MHLRSRYSNLLISVLICVCNRSFGQHFQLSSTISDANSRVTCLTLSSDGKQVISGDESGVIIFRDAESGKPLTTVKPFSSAVENINLNSTGRLMIVSTRDGEIKIYDFDQGKFIQSLFSPEYSDMHFALFSIADGFIYFNGKGRLYKTRSDLTQPVIKIFECDSIIANAVITDDRSALIFSCGNSIKVLNTRTDNIIQEIIASPSTIEQLTWLAGNNLASWSSDGTIMIRKYELNQLHNDPTTWFKAGTSSRLVFSHRGDWMVTGRVGTWARVWKPSDHSISQELFGHKDEVTNFVFSVDDQTLFTASNDKTIKIWKQKKEEQIVIPSKDSIFKEVTFSSSKTSDSLPSMPVTSGFQDHSMPVIEMDQRNIPFNLGGRKVDKTSVVEINDSELDIYVFDNSTFDGDIMSLAFNNQWIMTHYEVTKKKRKITLHLTSGSANYLVLFADNLGKTPPNTAAISFKQNGRERIFRLESDLKSCSAINFVYKSK